MIRIEPFRPEHVKGAVGAPEHYRDAFDETFIEAALKYEAWTAIDGSQTVYVGMGGIVGESFMGWGSFTDKAKPHHVLSVFRIMKKVMPVGAEAHIDPQHPVFVRWAKLLGMEECGEDIIEGRVMTRVRFNGP